MSPLRLILREMAHGALGTVLTALVIGAAAASVVGSLASLRQHDRETEAILERKRVETVERVARLQDDYRKMMKRMGFNILILPREQNLGDFYAEDFAARDMPEEYIRRLAEQNLVTVRHLLPSLQARVEWPEMRRRIMLVGIRQEVAAGGGDKEGEILKPVKPGTVVVGHELHTSLGLKAGAAVTIRGRTFTIAKLQEERGNKDDITVWMDLAEAQDLLGRPGRINAIQALECQCAWADVGKVRAEIGRVLPETQVIELSDMALARAEARRRAATEAEQALDAVRRHREALRLERERFAGLLIPAIAVIAAAWVAALTFMNVNERRYEIALYRALGMGMAGVMGILLAKVALTGAIGAGLGALAGLGWEAFVTEAGGWRAFATGGDAAVAVTTVAVVTALALVAAWPCVLYGCRRDPADDLGRE